jgi:hypothetical protein
MEPLKKTLVLGAPHRARRHGTSLLPAKRNGPPKIELPNAPI